MTKGFSGIRDDINHALKELKVTDPDASVKKANLLAWLHICDAGISLGRRYAEYALSMANASHNLDEKKEWELKAEICSRVPAYPARTFREALQSLWFAHMITVWEDYTNANGIGRIDQFLLPFFQNDIDSGRLNIDEAAELLAAFWIKLYLPYDVQQIMLGGQKPDGTDSVNTLSYLALDVTEGLDFIRCLSVRVHKNTPPKFISRCVDLIARGGGIPFLFNDEALIPALTSSGIPLEDARGYAAIGCIEITIPGKANPHAVSNWINFAKVLELAINDGKDIRDDV